MIINSNNQHIKQIIERYYMFKFHIKDKEEALLNKLKLLNKLIDIINVHNGMWGINHAYHDDVQIGDYDFAFFFIAENDCNNLKNVQRLLSNQKHYKKDKHIGFIESYDKYNILLINLDYNYQVTIREDLGKIVLNKNGNFTLKRLYKINKEKYIIEKNNINILNNSAYSLIAFSDISLNLQSILFEFFYEQTKNNLFLQLYYDIKKLKEFEYLLPFLSINIYFNNCFNAKNKYQLLLYAFDGLDIPESIESRNIIESYCICKISECMISKYQQEIFELPLNFIFNSLRTFDYFYMDFLNDKEKDIVGWLFKDYINYVYNYKDNNLTCEELNWIYYDTYYLLQQLNKKNFIDIKNILNNHKELMIEWGMQLIKLCIPEDSKFNNLKLPFIYKRITNEHDLVELVCYRNDSISFNQGGILDIYATDINNDEMAVYKFFENKKRYILIITLEKNKFVLNSFNSLNYGRVKRKDYGEIRNIIKYYNDKN